MTQELEIYDPKNMSIAREPEIILNEAKKAAQALQSVISKKLKPFILNGEQYLEFEDWQTVGRFYGVTAKIINTEFIDYGTAKGFFARAVTLRSDGAEISAAEAMCLDDERNWKGKPLFQLRSMAQTRACAKALRNVLAWVVVLAGYRATPAEEMQDVTPPKITPVSSGPKEKPPESEKTNTQTQPETESKSSEPTKEKTNYQEKCEEFLFELCGSDEFLMIELIQECTSFKDKKTGNQVEGKSSLSEISEKAIPIVYAKLKKKVEELHAHPKI